MTHSVDVHHEFHLSLEREIAAPIDTVWEIVLEEVGPRFPGENGGTIDLELETFPGGRWFRNLGSAGGHLWGHVQAIKPPTLLELCGPMFMSMPVLNNVQYRLEGEGDGSTILRFRHTAFGPMPEELGDSMRAGWDDHVRRIGRRAEGGES